MRNKQTSKTALMAYFFNGKQQRWSDLLVQIGLSTLLLKVSEELPLKKSMTCHS